MFSKQDSRFPPFLEIFFGGFKSFQTVGRLEIIRYYRTRILQKTGQHFFLTPIIHTGHVSGKFCFWVGWLESQCRDLSDPKVDRLMRDVVFFLHFPCFLTKKIFPIFFGKVAIFLSNCLLVMPRPGSTRPWICPWICPWIWPCICGLGTWRFDPAWST